MGFHGKDRPEILSAELGEEFTERDIPLTHRQMLIHVPVVVVDVNLPQSIAEGLDPKNRRDTAEDVRMAGIETETGLRRVQGVEQVF